MPRERVHAEAEVLEHVVSDELEALLVAKLGPPSSNPREFMKTTADLVVAEWDTVRLAALDPGDRGILVRIPDQDPEVLRYLQARDIAPGSNLEVIERQPLGGPLSVRIGSGTHAFGGALAEAMCVRRTETAHRDHQTTKHNGDCR